MHPQLYLRTFWKEQLKPQIFVAMSFDPIYKSRFEDIIAPAIQSIALDGTPLSAYRVDISKTGDSILTDIMDGIAHSQMVLADVSSIGKDSKTGNSYRNANVMYEVGLALACRHSSEVLLLRDDRDQFLFDVSTVPHKNIDFTNTEAAKAELHEELIKRLNEREYLDRVRVEIAFASLSEEEITQIQATAHFPPNTPWGKKDNTNVNFTTLVALPRLLDKNLIRCVGQFETGSPAFVYTQLGLAVIKRVEAIVKFVPDQGKQPPEANSEETS